MNHDKHFLALFQAIAGGALVLTPNRRLATTLHKLYQTYQQNQQHACWQTPDILPLSSWLQRLWHDVTSQSLSHNLFLLNSAQEHFLWESIVSQSKESAPLLQVAETADIAKSAWGLLKQWEVDIHDPLFDSAEDYLALKHWATQFHTLCQEKHWIDTASLPEVMREYVDPADKPRLTT